MFGGRNRDINMDSLNLVKKGDPKIYPDAAWREKLHCTTVVHSEKGI